MLRWRQHHIVNPPLVYDCHVYTVLVVIATPEENMSGKRRPEKYETREGGEE